MFNLLLVSISYLYVYFFLLFNLVKKDLTNSLLNAKKIVIKEIISPVGAPIAAINHATLILLLLIEGWTRFLSKSSRVFTYLHIHLYSDLSFSFTYFFNRKSSILLSQLILDSEFLAPEVME